MTKLDAILVEFERALELERELGVRRVPCDRTVLCGHAGRVTLPERAKTPESREMSVGKAGAKPPGAADVVFLHDRPLGPEEAEMLEKIVRALGLTPARAPVVFAAPIPVAGRYVFLGEDALRRFMPDMRCEPNRWMKSPKGKDILLVWSPRNVLRFGDTDVARKLKSAMWGALKRLKV